MYYYLNWKLCRDENRNYYWIAPSKYDNLYYKIVQRLENNKIVYVEDSHESLWLDYRSPYRERWDDKHRAMRDMDSHFQTSLIKLEEINYDNTRSIQ